MMQTDSRRRPGDDDIRATGDPSPDRIEPPWEAGRPIHGRRIVRGPPCWGRSRRRHGKAYSERACYSVQCACPPVRSSSAVSPDPLTADTAPRAAGVRRQRAARPPRGCPSSQGWATRPRHQNRHPGVQMRYLASWLAGQPQVLSLLNLPQASGRPSFSGPPNNAWSSWLSHAGTCQ